MTDNHSNPKGRVIIRKYGMRGYGFLHVCREIVGKYGVKYRLKDKKSWKNLLQEATLIENGEMEELLKALAENGDICSKALKNGELYIPKMREYSDDYTNRIRRKYGLDSDNVPLDKIRIDKIREEENKIRKEEIDAVVDFYVETAGYDVLTLHTDDWVRFKGAAKVLLIKTNMNMPLAKEAISWVSIQGYQWTLETVIKKYPDFLKTTKSDAVLELEREVLSG